MKQQQSGKRTLTTTLGALVLGVLAHGCVAPDKGAGPRGSAASSDQIRKDDKKHEIHGEVDIMYGRSG